MFIHKENDLFLDTNCQPTLAHRVLLLLLAQLERSYCFLAHNSKGFWTQAGDQEQGSKAALREWKQDDFCSKHFLGTHPFLHHRPHAEGTPRPRKEQSTNICSTHSHPHNTAEKGTANWLTIPWSHPSWRLNSIDPISQMTGRLYVWGLLMWKGCERSGCKV